MGSRGSFAEQHPRGDEPVIRARAITLSAIVTPWGACGGHQKSRRAEKTSPCRDNALHPQSRLWRRAGGTGSKGIPVFRAGAAGLAGVASPCSVSDSTNSAATRRPRCVPNLPRPPCWRLSYQAARSCVQKAAEALPTLNYAAGRSRGWGGPPVAVRGGKPRCLAAVDYLLVGAGAVCSPPPPSSAVWGGGV